MRDGDTQSCDVQKDTLSIRIRVRLPHTSWPTVSFFTKQSTTAGGVFFLAADLPLSVPGISFMVTLLSQADG
jgi:hypothetical protein